MEKEQLQKLIGMCDHTLLLQGSTTQEIHGICDDAMRFQTASICIPPCYVKEAKEYMSQIREAYQKERQELLSSQKARAIGNKFTDIAMNDTTGRERRLSEWCGKGRYVLIDFWASWCGPCRAEMPNVTACYEKYHAKGLDIVAISFDTNKDAWLRAINTMKMPWVHLSDLAGWNSLGAKTYDIKGIPANILLDGEGNIIDNDLRDYMLEEKLAEIFGE